MAGYEAFVDFDRRDGIQVSEQWEQRLYTELGKSDAVVCVVSSSFVASPWCDREVAIAKALGKRLVPLSIERGVRHELLEDLQHNDYLTDRPDAVAGVVNVLRGIPVVNGWPDGRGPFPGLRAFDADWRRMFFGRERDIAVLAELLRSPVEQVTGQVVTVVGPSGCGKSSLVRAGLVPVMVVEPGWWVLEPVVPGVDPVGALARELAAASVRLGVGWTVDTVRARLADASGLADLADELLVAASGQHRYRRLLLVVDQFEETLTRASPERRGQFARLLAHAVVGSVAVVTTLRPEFLGSLSVDPALADLKVRRPVLVGPLDAAGLVTVVVEPARVAGIEVDDTLVRRIVAETGTGEALPLLAYALEQLAAGVRRGGSLSVQRYDGIGGVTGALSIQADKALATARERGGRSAGEVIAGLLRLVTVDETGRPTRRRVDYAELPEPVRAELAAFVDRRLLTTDEVDGVVSVGVAHEAFLTAWPPLANAVAQAGAALRTRREVEYAAADWDAAVRPRQRLWGRGHLAAAVANLGARVSRPAHGVRGWFGRRVLMTERLDLGETGRQFLHASIRRDRALRRRSIVILSALLAVAVAAAGAATVNQNKAQEQQQKAQEQQRVATARQLMAQAQGTVDLAPQTALRLSLAARSIHPDAETDFSVFNTLTATQNAGTLTGHTGAVFSVVFSPDGHTLATGGADGTVRLWDVADRAHPQPLGQPLTAHTSGVFPVVFSPDGHTLATGSADGTVRLWSIDALLDLRARAVELACAYSGGGLDHGEWDRYVTGLPYRDSCPAP